jgi:hypothetical protein
VLISQNRMAAAADKRADLDLQVSLLAEHEVTKLVTVVSGLADRMGSEADAEVKEIARDVAPEAVRDELEATESEAAWRLRHTNVHLPQRKRPAIGCLIAPSTGGTVWRVAERSGGGTASTATIIRSGGYSGCDPDYNIACPPGIGTTAPEM